MIVAVSLLPRTIIRLFGAADRVKFPNGFTVRAIVVVAIMLPDVPVTRLIGGN
jgi:hypothetical protein